MVLNYDLTHFTLGIHVPYCYLRIATHRAVSRVCQHHGLIGTHDKRVDEVLEFIFHCLSFGDAELLVDEDVLH